MGGQGEILGLAWGSADFFFFLAGGSGILSAHCLLLAKSAVELLVRTIVDRVNQFNRWQSWMILLGLVTLALTQLYYLHRGLKLCSTSVLYPLVFCVYNIIAILDGLLYYRQASRLTPLHGCLVCFLHSCSAIYPNVMPTQWVDCVRHSHSPYWRSCPFMAPKPGTRRPTTHRRQRPVPGPGLCRH